MVNPSSKINNAIFIIKKFNTNVNVQRTDSADTVYLFDYSTQKKTIGSAAIKKAADKAAGQQDWPSDVVYSDGMLTIITPEIKEAKDVETAELFEAETVTETVEEQPKKRTRKKKSVNSDSEA